MDLITLEEYKDFNGISANPKDDAKHSMLISMVSALIQTYLGIDAAGAKSVTEVISLDYDTNIIYLDNYPITGPVSVSETSRYTYDSTVHVPLVYASEYFVNEAQGTLTRALVPGGFASWPISPGLVTVSYQTAPTWGEDTTDIPADLKLAAIELVNYYKNSEWQAKAIQGSSTSITPTQSGTDFPQHIQVLLDKYKK